jgi:hypothetical protein
MRACSDRGIWRAVRGSGSTGAAASSLRTGAGDSIESTRGFRAGCSAEGAGSETGGFPLLHPALGSCSSFVEGLLAGSDTGIADGPFFGVSFGCILCKP